MSSSRETLIWLKYNELNTLFHNSCKHLHFVDDTRCQRLLARTNGASLADTPLSTSSAPHVHGS